MSEFGQIPGNVWRVLSMDVKLVCAALLTALLMCAPWGQYLIGLDRVFLEQLAWWSKELFFPLVISVASFFFMLSVWRITDRRRDTEAASLAMAGVHAQVRSYRNSLNAVLEDCLHAVERASKDKPIVPGMPVPAKPETRFGVSAEVVARMPKTYVDYGAALGAARSEEWHPEHSEELTVEDRIPRVVPVGFSIADLSVELRRLHQYAENCRTARRSADGSAEARLRESRNFIHMLARCLQKCVALDEAIHALEENGEYQLSSMGPLPDRPKFGDPEEPLIDRAYACTSSEPLSDPRRPKVPLHSTSKDHSCDDWELSKIEVGLRSKIRHESRPRPEWVGRMRYPNVHRHWR